MTVKNQSYRGVLKTNLKLGQIAKRLFQVLVQLSLTTTEIKLDYYHNRWSVQVAPKLP